MKQSKRVEFTKSEKKQIEKAAFIKGQSSKKFIEMAAIALSIQTLTSYGKFNY